MPRPCTCDQVESCRPCWLYANDPRYTRLWADPPTVQESYVISLKRRQDRRDAIAQQFGREGISYRLVDAVDGQGAELPPGWRAGAGAWGCWRSHLAVLDDAIARGLDTIHVFEDDVSLVPGYATKLAKLLDDVANYDPNWDAIFPGGQHMEPPVEVAPGLVRCLNTHRTHDYIVRGSYVKKLRDWWGGIDTHIDHVWGNGSYQRDHRVYAPREWLSGQSAGQSDINGRKLGLRMWAPRKVVPAPAPTLRPTEPRKPCGGCGKKKLDALSKRFDQAGQVPVW